MQLKKPELKIIARYEFSEVREYLRKKYSNEYSSFLGEWMIDQEVTNGCERGLERDEIEYLTAFYNLDSAEILETIFEEFGNGKDEIIFWIGW